MIGEIQQITAVMDSWGLMFVGEPEAMVTPEALNIAEGFNAALKEKGCVAVVSCSLNMIMSAFAKKINQNSGMGFLVTDSPTEGRAYIRSLLAH